MRRKLAHWFQNSIFCFSVRLYVCIASGGSSVGGVRTMEREKGASKRAIGSVKHVVTLAVLSRLLLFALFVLWRAVARPYDTSAALNLPCLSATNGT